MATISPTISMRGHDDSVRIYKFETLTTTNADGSPIAIPEYSQRSVQVIGTFGAGGTIVVQGSNDGGTTWATLNDPQGSALSLTAAGVHSVQELSGLTRVNVTGGDGTTDLDAYVLCRRPTRLRA